MQILLGLKLGIVGFALGAFPLLAVFGAHIGDSLAATSATGHSPTNTASAAVRRPNIVFIRTDDETVRDMQTRKPDGTFVMQNVIDQVAKKGVTFSNSFVSYSVCSPSRATFLTGRYAHNHHVLGNVGPHGGYAALDHTHTLAVWETRNGYYTCHVGKYLNSYTGGIPPGWSEWYTCFASQYFGYDVNENGTTVHYGSNPGDYITDVQTGEAVSFITNRHYGDRPFFLVVDYTAPHGTDPAIPNIGIMPVPAPWFEAIFAGYVPNWPPNFDERDVSDKPPFIQAIPLFSRSTMGQIVAQYRAVYGTLLSVDDGVGRIIHALESSGQIANTVVFFTSDNGIQRGEHRISGGKNRMYEESIRVPLVVRGPGIRSDAIIDDVVANIDYAPTIVELTGATVDIGMDGISLVPVMTGTATLERSGILLESYVGLTQQPIGLRTRDYYYGEYADGFVELYSLEDDPHELVNQANNSIYTHIVGQLHVHLQELRHVQPQ